MKRLLLFFMMLNSCFAGAQVVVRRPAIPVRPAVREPDVAALDPDPEFPVKVHLFNVRWGGEADINHGYGTGNLIDGTKLTGFDFAFECGYPFMANAAPDETYQARWKKNNQYQMEILTLDVSGKHLHTCMLHLAYEVRPFTPQNRAHFDHGVSSSLRVRWSDPDFAYETPDPAYPLQFHVIDGIRMEGPADDQGHGNANLSDPANPAGLQGADYNYICGRGFINSSQYDNYYQGRWVKPGQRMELLLQRPGSDKVDTCEVNVMLKPGPYPEPHRKDGDASAP